MEKYSTENGKSRIIRGKYPEKIRDHVRPFIELDPDRIEVVFGDIPDWIIRKHSPVYPTAITIGFKTWYFPKGYRLKVIFHEIKHADQFEELNEKFTEIYSRQIREHFKKHKKNGDYQDIPLEKECNQFSEKMMGLWKEKHNGLWTGRYDAKNQQKPLDS